MSLVPYSNVVGSLIYALVYNTLNITHEMVEVSKHMSKLRKEHSTKVNRVFKYLCGMNGYGCNTKEAFDWKKCLTYMTLLMETRLEIWIVEDQQKGMCLTYYKRNQLDKQDIVYSDTLKYRSKVHDHHSCKYVNNMVIEILFRYWLVQHVMRIDNDSQSVVFLVKNTMYHSKIKHIDVQYHFMKYMVEEKKKCCW